MSRKSLINATTKELAYRNKHFHDIRVVKNRQITCASCGNELNITSGQIYSHPLMGLLQCETCWRSFKETDVIFDEIDEIAKYCYICGNGKILYGCNNEDCIASFCKRCIKRNANICLLDIENDDWKCFICKPKPIWELRAVCAAVMDSLPKRGNRKNKIEKAMLPSKKKQLVKTKIMQKAMQTLCDTEDDECSVEEERPRISSPYDRHRKQETIVHQKRLMDNNSSDSSDNTSESNEDKKETIRNRSAKSKQDFDDSEYKTSTSVANRKYRLRNKKMSSDSEQSSTDTSSSEINTRKRVTRSNIVVNKKKNKSSIQINSSDDESDDNSTNNISNKFENLPKHTVRQNQKKYAKLCNMKPFKYKIKECEDTNSESEDEFPKKDKKAQPTINEEGRSMTQNNIAKKRHLSEICKGSDSSSSKEFMKSKFFRNKHSTVRQLVDLNIDYTKSPDLGNEKTDKSKKKESIDDPSNISFDNIKEILNECKDICSSFKMYIESMQQQYGKKDEEEIIFRTTRKINKFKTILDKKQKSLITYHRTYSKNRKSLTKISHKEVSDDEKTSNEINAHKKHTEDEDKSHNSENELETKNISECDSEEIFSADETRTPQKMQTTRNEMNKSKTESNLDNPHTDDDINTLINILNNEDNTDSEGNSGASPVLGVLNEKKDDEQLNKRRQIPESDNNSDTERTEKQSIPVEINFTDKQLEGDIYNNEIVAKSPSIKQAKEKVSLQNNKEDTSSTHNDAVNESMDIFDISFNDAQNVEDKIQGQEINTINDKTPSITKSSENEAGYEIYDNDENLINADMANLSHNDEKNLGQDGLTDASESSIMKDDSINNSKEINIAKEINILDVIESLESEKLVKKTLLDSDSEILDDAMNMINAIQENVKLSTENINSKKNNAESDNSIDSTNSTIILSKDAVDIANIEELVTSKIRKETENKSDKKGKENSSNEDENVKAEKVAKETLLESNSDTASFSSSDQEDIFDKPLNPEIDNANAKKALLVSTSSDSSNSDISSEIETNNSKNSSKYNDKSNSNKTITPGVKKGRLKLSNNYYYMNDKKLRMKCNVHIKRLDKKVLKRYSHALKKSRQYLESKALNSLVNLDTLEKKHKNTRDSNISTDDDALSIPAKKLNKRKGKATEEESLMDHLKKVENDEITSIVQMDSNSDESIHEIADAKLTSNETLMLEADKVAKQNLLNSSDSDIDLERKMVSNSDDSTNDDDKSKKNKDKGRTLENQKKSEEKTSKKDEEKKNKSDWRQDKILTSKFSSSDSDIEEKKWNKKEKRSAEQDNSDFDEKEKKSIKSRKKKIRRRILDSDSDIKLTDFDSDSDISSVDLSEENAKDSSDSKIKKEKKKLKKRKHGESSNTDSSIEEKRSKPKHRRIKKMASDSDSSDATQSQQGSPNKSGRKNIRKVLKDKQVAEDTKQAAKEEEERIKRIAERQARYNEMYEIRLAGEEKVEKLVLDFDTETKEELVSVHEELVKRLKPHQAQGIKFMWDACFESLERIKTTVGSGCIIAHCMGLGKSLQVVSLTHTLLNNEASGVKTVIIVCPLSTVLNWVNEYNTWLKNIDDDIEIYELTKFKKMFERKYQLQRWRKTGGILIIGYEMFRNLTGTNKNIRKGIKEVITECLVDPGADLIVCDEGHLLKNEDTALSKCMRRVKTMRRVVLTGTPLQNNLVEYHCMVQFVKPNLLGTKKEFLNRFVNPITNGQFDDSTEYDVKLMKKRAHVLHKMLEGCVQRFDYSVLTPFLPPKQEYVIFVRLTDVQIKMYKYYLENLARRPGQTKGALFTDFQALQRVWTHPIVLRLNAEKIEKANEKKFSSDTEGSLKDFIDDDSSDADTSTIEESDDSDVQAIDNTKDIKRKTRNNPGEEEPEPLPKENSGPDPEWWSQYIQPEHFEDIKVSAKLLLLFGILKESEQIGDKVLVFSQSLYSLTLIEQFLGKIDNETQNQKSLDTLDNHSGSWSLGLDYFRLDGQTSAENRTIWCRIFNRPTNTRARLFLISTRAGGLGINLTAANRVIIFDASWNPSHDVQSIFRIYRFGQKKPCYVYRFLAAGTMEEKIYNRQVTKLSLSCRVVDEQQIERHYSNHNLNELYSFDSYNYEERPTLNLPKDRLLAEIFLKYKDFVESYHEHDSLLENKAEEELDEEERKQAWLEYEEEKKGKPIMNPAMSAYQNNLFLQQCNMLNSESGMMPQNISMQVEYEKLQELIRKDYPNVTLEQQKFLTNRVFMDMYNFWEQHAILQPNRNTITQLNPQLNQLLKAPLQPGNYMKNSTAQNVAQRNMVLNPFTYRNVATNNAEKIDDDVVELAPTTSSLSIPNTRMAVQSTTANRNQEE